MNTKSLNKTNLQLIAIVAMLIDHSAYFVGVAGEVITYYIMHVIGRITIVIMCYFIAEGFYRTRNVDKYIARMGIFAIISQIPFYLNKLGTLPTGLYSFMSGNYHNRNVIFTLFVALCLLVIIKSNYSAVIKALAVVAALYLVRCSDWGWACLAWVLVFALFRDNPKYQMTGTALIVVLRVCIQLLELPLLNRWHWVYIISSLIQLGGLLAIPLLLMYNGEKGNMPGKLFYIFYPAHLILLYIIKLIVF